MLKKLLKYDLKNIFNQLSLLWIVSIVSAVISQLITRLPWDNIFTSVLYVMTSLVTYLTIILLLIAPIVVAIKRTYEHLFKAQGYLTNTLPITKSQLLLSKTIAAFLTFLISLIVVVVAIAILYWGESLTTNGLILKDILISLTIFLFAFYIHLFIFILLAYALGQRHDSKKIGHAFIYGLIGYIIIQIVLASLIFGYVAINKDFMILLENNDIPSIRNLLFSIAGIFVIIAGINFTATNKILNKKMDLE